MSDEYPAVPNRLNRALEHGFDESEVEEIWQALVDEFGQHYGDTLEIRFTVQLPEED